MHTISMGQADWVASNSTKEGKKKNRRVEIMVSIDKPVWRVTSETPSK
jgi:outer membrane protein OmpA-like peptidoglycan-associated protein